MKAAIKQMICPKEISPSPLNSGLMQAFHGALLQIARTLGLAFVYFVSAWLGSNFGFLAGTVSPVWPPAGVGLCFLILGGWKNLPAVVLGVVAVEYFHNLPPLAVAGITLGNTLEVAGGYLILSRLEFRNQFDRTRDVVALTLTSLLAPVIGSSIGTVALWAIHYSDINQLTSVWSTWWSGDVLGIIVVAPVILSWWKTKREKLSHRKIAEIALLGIGLATACWIIFASKFGRAVSDSSLAFMTFPFLLWAALRFGMKGASLACGFVAFVAIQSVSAFTGPFRAVAQDDNIWLLQMFQAVSSVTALIVAALITERTASTIALRTSELRLQETQKYESLGIMAGGIAHDFNNLLTAVLCHAELLQLRQKGNPLIEEHTEEIQKAGRKASALCQQMVAFSGCSIVADVEVELNDWLGQHDTEISHTLPGGSRLQIVMAKDKLPANIHPDQLIQAVKNLIENAAESYEGKSGLVEIETGLRKIDDTNSRHNLPSLQVPNGNYVYITVRDNGLGMSPDVKARIFEPFYSTKFTGRGLGLAFVLGIVRGHQGTMQVVSQHGKGTEMTIFLPIHMSPEEKPESQSEPAGKRAGMSYLMVDDDDLVREITVALLEETGAKVYAANNGLDALSLYQNHRDEIDVALIDWIMPGMTGYEVARSIRSLKPGQPIVLVSGFTNEEISLDLPGTGKTTFLPKPFMTKDIVAKVQEVMT